MIIANAERTVADIRKLRDYCLNPLHANGKHKAQLGRRDVYGQRYIVDFSPTWHEKQIMIRSGWIIEHGTDTPRLTTCYPL